MQLIYDVRKAVHSSEKSISSELQTSLDISLAQQTLQHTMNFDEFSELKSDIRVSIQILFVHVTIKSLQEN